LLPHAAEGEAIGGKIIRGRKTLTPLPTPFKGGGGAARKKNLREKTLYHFLTALLSFFLPPSPSPLSMGEGGGQQEN